jgi:hypothetical protein
MTEDLDSRYRRLLAKQLVINEETWERLRTHGVDEATQLRLDFSYAAADRASAESLKTVLSDQTDYDMKVQSTGTFTKRWTVTGSTQATAVSNAILDQWVDWMVTAGLHHNCEFDGWGTEVPPRDRVT